jgi:hypothetical protein
MQRFNDLIEQVIPSAPSDEIPQDAFVRQIGQRFNSQYQRQRIVGSLKSGKTNLMAQFVRQYSNQCIAYFITNDPSTQLVHAFLYTLCLQINLLLGNNAPLESATVNELEALLTTTSIKLASEARKRKTTHYFVIDGIENSLEGAVGERIIDKLPLLKPAPYSPYVLFSCRSDQVYRLPEYLNCPNDIVPPEFSRLEVETYFREVGFSQQEIIKICDKYRPLPGYLKILKDSKRANPNFDLETASLELDQLIEEQVQLVMRDLNELTTSVLKILVASPVSLPIEILTEMTGSSENSLQEHLQQINITKLDEQRRRLEFADDMVCDAVRKWFSEYIEDTTKELLVYVQNNCPNENLLLTLLLEEVQDYEGVQSALACQEIIGTLNVNRDILSVMRRLRSASKMSLDRGYTEDLVKWTLGITVAHSFIEHAADSQEIEALLAIGDSQEALRKAYLIPEASSKVRLLARAYTVMKDRGDRLQGEALDELVTMVNNLDLYALDKEIAFEIAVDLFPVRPEAAFSLLEKVIGQRQNRSIIEVAIEAIESASEKATQEEVAITPSVKHEVNLGYIAQILSSWLNGLPLPQILEEIKAVENTQAKEYIIRQWCRQNREDPDVVKAINHWLDVVIDDRDFVILLRSLRHISEIVAQIPLLHRQRLITRLQGPEINALDSPEEEWVRFHLNIAEGMFEIDREDAIQRIEAVHQRICCEGLVTLDVKVFCLSRLWVTIKKLCPDNSDWKSEVNIQFNEAFYAMLNNSAEQYETAIETILTLIEVDPERSLALAIELNTYFRRAKAIRRVLTTTLRKRGHQNLVTFIQDALDITEKTQTHRDSLLVRVVSELNAREVRLASENIETLLKYAQKIGDPTLKAQAFSHLAVLLYPTSSDDAMLIMDKAIESWEQEEDLKLGLSVGFRLVQDIAKLDIERAKTLYDTVQNRKFQPGAGLAIGDLGAIFKEVLELAIRSVTRNDLDKDGQGIEQLKEYIRKVPSRIIRIRLFAMLAASAYRVDRKEYADKLVQTAIIKELERMQPDFSLEHVDLETLQGVLIQQGNDLTLDGQVLYKSKSGEDGVSVKTLQKYVNHYVEVRGQVNSKRFEAYSIRKLEFQHDFNESLIFCLPMIYEYDFSTAKKFADLLSFPAKDYAWCSSIFWALSRSFLGDHHFDPDSLRIPSDNRRLKKAIKAASEIEHDVLLYRAISVIARSVNVSTNNLDLTQAFDILVHLDELATNLTSKSSENIKHQGYSILAQAIIHGVRSAIYQTPLYRKSRNKGTYTSKHMRNRWRSINQEAEAISNVADRVFVMALIAPEMVKYYTNNQSSSREILRNAEAEIENIPNLIDRADRLQTIADSWNALGDKSHAEVICDRVFELVSQLEGAGADERLRLLIQAAYKVEADFADDLTSRLDSRLPNQIVHPAQLDLEVEKLRRNPAKLSELQHNRIELQGIIIQRTAHKLLEDFATGKGVTEHSKIWNDWLVEASLHQSSSSIGTIHWVVESLYRMTSHASPQNRLDIFLQNAQLTYELAKWVSNQKGEGIPEQIQDSFPGLSGKFVTFRRGEAGKAKNWLEDWLRNNVRDYLKICDPYFGMAQFEYFKYVPADCTILVITTEKGLTLKDKSNIEIENAIEQYWGNLTNRMLPRTQVIIVPESLEERFHDRLIISSNSGLDIGPSINGLGTSYQKITVLSEEDAREQEQGYLSKMLYSGTWFMEGVRPVILFIGGD